MELKIGTSSEFVEAVKKLAAIQGEEVIVVKNATNPHFKNGYANLGQYLEKIQPILKKHNAHCFQNVAGSYLTTTFMDLDSGQWISADYPLLITGAKPQEIASQITYARRYSLSALFMLVAEDDDGNEANGTPSPKPANNQVKPWLNESSEGYKVVVKAIEDGEPLENVYAKYNVSNVVKEKLQSIKVKIKPV